MTNTLHTGPLTFEEFCERALASIDNKEKPLIKYQRFSELKMPEISNHVSFHGRVFVKNPAYVEILYFHYSVNLMIVSTVFLSQKDIENLYALFSED